MCVCVFVCVCVCEREREREGWDLAGADVSDLTNPQRQQRPICNFSFEIIKFTLPYLTQYHHHHSHHSPPPPPLLPPQVALPNPSPDRAVGSEPVTFGKEFQNLSRPLPSNPTRAGRQHNNNNLNNTPTILPYDSTRVVLNHDGTGGGDYINARCC